MDDEDFDYKIKWFFDRVEQQQLEDELEATKKEVINNTSFSYDEITLEGESKRQK